MANARWYDKNSQLNEFVSYLEEQEREVQDVFAQHLLQILIYEFNFNLDLEIGKMSEPCDYEYNRWYDDNVELFTIFEFVKKLSSEEQSYLVDSVISHVLIDNMKDSSNE